MSSMQNRVACRVAQFQGTAGGERGLADRGWDAGSSHAHKIGTGTSPEICTTLLLFAGEHEGPAVFCQISMAVEERRKGRLDAGLGRWLALLT